MAPRTKPYMVRIQPGTALKGLSVEETLHILEKLVNKQVRLHKGHDETRPLPPIVTLSLSNGKEVRGQLQCVSAEAVETCPLLLTQDGFIVGVDYATVHVSRISAVVSVEYEFPQRQVDPINLRKKKQ